MSHHTTLLLYLYLYLRVSIYILLCSLLFHERNRIGFFRCACRNLLSIHPPCPLSFILCTSCARYSILSYKKCAALHQTTLYPPTLHLFNISSFLTLRYTTLIYHVDNISRCPRPQRAHGVQSVRQSVSQ